jgi:ATP-dependent Lon protease
MASPVRKHYVQGWFVGVSTDEAALIPYELGFRPGSGTCSYSGAVADDLIRSLILSIWSVQLCLTRLGCDLPQFDAHLHLPLNNIQATGPSCRLSLANGLLYACLETSIYSPSTTILLGDLSLHGDVLPVGNLARKIEIARAAGIFQIVISEAQSTHFGDVIQIESIEDLLVKSV